MTLNISEFNDPRSSRDADGVSRASTARRRETFSTDLFTSLNILVFLILAASVVGAAILYSQGA